MIESMRGIFSKLELVFMNLIIIFTKVGIKIDLEIGFHDGRLIIIVLLEVLTNNR
jgi:hypothetical protein